MKKNILWGLAFLLVLSTSSYAMAFGGCGEGSCSDCHSISKEQAREALEPLGVKAEVVSADFARVPGLWSVAVKDQRGQTVPIYLDYSLKYLIQGEIIEIATRESVTRMKLAALNRVDHSSVPIDDAIVLGDPNAKHKVIVFDDPECPYCKKLHESMKEVVKERTDIAFFIKMFPLKIHPTAYDKAKAVICEKSMELFEKSLNGEEIPPPTCETDQIEKNVALADKLGIKSTPSMILPDGRVIPGSRKPSDIISYIDNPLPPEEKKDSASK